jgi:glycosyltransferase involved in cell wall biosynthesis
MSTNERPLRVLHAPDLVGGHPPQLARAERELGLQSWAVAFRQSKYQYQVDEVLWQDNDSRLTFELKRLQLLGRALCHYDIIHFNFGHTFLPNFSCYDNGSRKSSWHRLKAVGARLLELRDLPLLKWAGKGIVMTFQGDDARQGNALQQRTNLDLRRELEPGYYSAASDAHKQKRIARIARYADCLYALNPDLLHVLPSRTRFLPYAHVDPREWSMPPGTADATRPPVVLHAPTHRGIKGTRLILEAVNRLQAEGIAFHFQLVENLTRAEARTLYEQCDLLIDQVLLSWYGGLAVELMALGKPVICYVREEDLAFVPVDMRCELPIINAEPANLYHVLREWLTARRHDLPALGRRCRQYVERWHDPRKIAAQVIGDYQRIMARQPAPSGDPGKTTEAAGTTPVESSSCQALAGVLDLQMSQPAA